MSGHLMKGSLYLILCSTLDLHMSKELNSTHRNLRQLTPYSVLVFNENDLDLVLVCDILLTFSKYMTCMASFGKNYYSLCHIK